MSPPTVALAADLPDELIAALGARYALVGPLALPLAASAGALDAGVRDRVRAIVSIGTVPIDGAAMDRFAALGAIVCLGSGYEGVDLVAARARGIAVGHSPGANAVSVAEVAMGLLIGSLRGFRAASDRLHAGGWQGNAGDRGMPTMGLAGARLGIYGMGAIGRAIAQRARAFDMDIGYHNRRPLEGEHARYFDTLPALAHWCDALVVSVRAAAATRHAVGREVLDALGPQGHVVNIARGSVIDEVELIAALTEGRIAGAGLDVYEHEPDVPPALLALRNVLALPHIGGASTQARAAMAAMTLANLEAFFAGASLPAPVPG